MNKREWRMLQDARTRHGRRKTGCFLCEGTRCCIEGIRRRPEWLEQVLVSASFADSPRLQEFLEQAAVPQRVEPVVLADSMLDELAETENPQGIVCLFRRESLVPADHRPADPFILVLDRIAEPGNMGTILRTAWAIGLTEVWLTKGTTDPFGSKAIRAGMGAQFALYFREFDDLGDVRDALIQWGYPRLWVGTPAGDTLCTEAAFELHYSGLVIGNEASGSAIVPGAESVRIPMPGHAESLNAAQAATLLLFEGVRQGLFQAEKS